MSARFDVLIVGAGLVGAAFALALRGHGLRVGLIDAAPPPRQSDDWDSRIYALSPASIEFLQALQVWPTIDPARLQPVRRMLIYGDAAEAELEFCSYTAGVASLATIIEARRLQYALWAALQEAEAADEISLYAARCTGLSIDDGAELQLDDDTVLRADLVVGADGANSWVRRAANLPATSRPYHALGVVANFACEKPHDGVAYQWFRPDGVLAFLPLAGERMSMVWSAPEEYAVLLQELPPAELTERVAEAGGQVLGKLELLSTVQAFPLQLLTVKQVVAPHLALIGDAAHVVHPLAGQGVNLGFGDAESLAQHLLERGPRHCGDYGLLRRHARSRAEPTAAMVAVTHGLQRLYASENRLLAAVRNRGLRYTDRLIPLKNLLVRHALG